MLSIPHSIDQPDRPAHAGRGPAGQSCAIAPVRRPRLRTAWLPGVQPERSPGAAAELGPCLRGQVLRDSESHHRHPGGRFPSPALEPGTAACTGGFYFGIPHPEEVAGTEAFVFGPGQDSHNL